jgi:hypothetical protein
MFIYYERKTGSNKNWTNNFSTESATDSITSTGDLNNEQLLKKIN